MTIQGAGEVVERFHQVLVESIHDDAPRYLSDRFTVAEIYQSLVPYRSHRDRLGVAMNGDYEDALLRLLAGEGEFLILESEPARNRIQQELDSRNPNTGIYREFAAAEVRLNPRRLPRPSQGSPPEPATNGGADPPGAQTLESALRTGEDPPAALPTQEASGSASPPAQCPDCSRALPVRDTLRYCPHCGTNTLEVPCRGCGEVLDRQWRFCVACGASAQG